jgi:hypothetical protein
MKLIKMRIHSICSEYILKTFWNTWTDGQIKFHIQGQLHFKKIRAEIDILITP